MSVNDHELLRQFTCEQSQDAFTALVNRHLNLVYASALRQVRSPQLAEEVSQTVFTQLARNAAKLKPDTLLTAWLYQVTRNTAIDVVRREARRQAREQIALQMSDPNDTPGDWTQVEPLLDEAMQSLGDTDRAAVLLRFFENKSLREVGEALGASEDAAQKRVNRALERLRDFLKRRKVTVSAGALAALLSAHASQAAPVGLAAVVVSSAVVSSTALSIPTVTTLAQTLTMTTLQKTIVAGLILAGIAFGSYQAVRVSRLNDQVRTLEREKQQVYDANRQASKREGNLDRGAGEAAPTSSQVAVAPRTPSEVLKLRGEVGRLRQENAQMGSRSALSKVTANAESRKLLRDQQKLGMSVVYKGLAQQMKLDGPKADKFNDLLADHIMDNVNNVTLVLRDKMSVEQMDRLFADQEAALRQNVEALLGNEGLVQYQDYTKDILSRLSVEQFKTKLTGTDAAREQKAKQLRAALLDASRAALSEAGLPEDYQTVPMLNFRNIASEPEGERSLKVLEAIYQRAADQGKSFLSAEELASLEEFKAAAVNNNRSALTLNRTMMAPIAD
jgi:RNA polymerase sigma factor (sigma-70 family)